MGLRIGDDFTLPMTVQEHRTQTLWPNGEADFWVPYGGITRARKLAQSLYEVSGNYEAAHQLIEEFHNGIRR